MRSLLIIAIALLCGVAFAGERLNLRDTETGKVYRFEVVADRPSELLGDDEREVLAELWRDKHPWAMRAQALADYPATKPAYGDFGQWGNLVSIGTGDRDYARKAVAQMLVTFDYAPANRNSTREGLIVFALHYRWLRPAMTDEQAAELRNRLFFWSDLCLGRRLSVAGKPWGTSLKDSDELTGHLLGVLLVAQVTAVEDPERSAAILNDPQIPKMREAFDRLCEVSEGGTLPESWEYELGTWQLAILGAHALGIENFPAIERLSPQIAEQQRWSLTPDLKDSAQWGDSQSPHDIAIYRRVSLLGLLAGLAGDEGSRSLLAELTKGVPVKDYWTHLYRPLWCFDPRVEAKPYVAPVGFRATNIGVCIERGPSHLFQAFAPLADTGFQHQEAYFPDVRLWLNGEWPLDHLIGYGASATAHNTAVMGGFARFPRMDRTVEATDYGCRIVTSSGGPQNVVWPWPPTFLDDWTRTVEFHRPNRIEVTDRFQGRKPNPEDYRAKTVIRAKIETAMALWQVIYHAPVEPQRLADGSGFEWQTAGGQTVRLRGLTRAVVLKTSMENVTGHFKPGQLAGWQVRFLSDEPDAEIKTTVRVGVLGNTTCRLHGTQP